MRSPGASTVSQRGGYTLLELMLVVALFSLAAGAIYPLGKTFYDRYVFREAHIGLGTALESAALRARTGLRDQDHGVKIQADAYVLFEGASYLTREPALDSVVPLPASITVSGPEEIVFLSGSGSTSATGTIRLSKSGETRTIRVHGNGVIE